MVTNTAEPTVNIPLNEQSLKSIFTSKSQLPIKRYLYAAALITIALVQTWAWTVVSEPKNNPFSDGISRLTTDWWLQPIETHAPLRLTIIDTEESIKSINLIGSPNTNKEQRLFIKFNDRNHVIIDQSGKLHQDAPPNNVLSSEPPQNYEIVFSEDSIQLDKAAIKTLNQISDKISAYEIKAYPKNRSPEYIQTSPSNNIPLPPGIQEPQLEITASTNIKGAVARKKVKKAMMDISGYLEKKNISNISLLGTIKSSAKQLKTKTPSTIVHIKLMLPPNISTNIFNNMRLLESIKWRKQSKQFNFYLQGNWRASKNGLIQVRNSLDEWKTLAATKSLLDQYFLEKREASWQKLSPHRYAPPFSILLMVILGTFGVTLLIMPPSAKRDNNSSIEDFFVTDAPIHSLNNDKLNFGPIAQSLSQFLRNERTTSPLTVAISGQWGSGKSSLMSLLKTDLEHYRLRPIWVNAWHHQNESQFLAGLLERIRNESLPPTFSAANIIFQINLLWIRIQRNPMRAIAASALLLIPLGYWIATGVDIIPTIKDTEKLASMLKGGSPLVSTGISFFLFLQLFGSKISSLTGNTWFRRLTGLNRKPLDLRSMVGLREKFVSEFRDICQALTPTTLTIFIDDLDRCNENRILDILESVNFLVSNGNCYIILGMEKEPIEKAIANYYRNTHTDYTEEQLQAKSKRYLEKLINIEVPVPETSPQQSAALTQTNTTENQIKFSKNLKTILACTLIFSILLCVGFYIGKSTPPEKLHEDVTQLEKEIEHIANPEQTNVDGDIHDKLTFESTPKTQPLTIIENNPVQSFNVELFILFLIFFTFIGYIVYERIMQRKHAVTTDSKEFESSLALWGKAVGDTRPTPRRIKRFINRTRYLAMRRNNSDSQLSEDELVTLAGIYEIDAKLLTSQYIGDSDIIFKRLKDTCTDAHLEPLQQLISESCNIENQESINKFKHWIDGVALR